MPPDGYCSYGQHFNPRTPRGVRHALPFRAYALVIFQSTHPARGATARYDHTYQQGLISIHAPREGCDSKLY